MNNIDIYCRVSTAEQAEEGYSLAVQEEKLRMYAAAKGWKVNAVHIDGGYSGAKLERPGIRKVIQDAENRKIDTVLVYKLDRLSRSQKDTLYLIEDVFLKNSVNFVSMTESLDTGTPLGMAMIGILAVFAQLEREQISERMMMGRIARAKEGQWRGGAGVPIGYKYVPKAGSTPGHIVVDEYEAAQVHKCFELFLSGKTYHAIYEYLKSHYTNKYGSYGGGANIVPAMLTNRCYIGQIKYQGIWYDGVHEPIIDMDTWEKAQGRIAEYKLTLSQHQREPYKGRHLLTGLLFCGECGARWCYHACRHKMKSGDYKVYETYTCYTRNAIAHMRTADHCSLKPWKKDELEDAVWSQIEQLSFEKIKESSRQGGADLTAYKNRIAEIDKQLERLIDLYALGSMPLDKIQERSQALENEREQLNSLIECTQMQKNQLSLDEALSLISDVHKIKKADMAQKRAYLQQLIDKIVLHEESQIEIHWSF